MNVVKEINSINQRQLELGGNSSWHDQYKDSAYVFVGGLDYDLTEGDVITIFSQYGEVADVNIPKDKKTQKSKGFAFLMYEDQRSTVLAVDNLNGAKVADRVMRVDHVDKYKQLEQDAEGKFKEREEQSLNARPENFLPVKNAESSSDSSDAEQGDPDLLDPMAAYLKDQKKASKKGKKKHDGESKEERKQRKLAKRVAKQAKKYSISAGGEPSSRKRERSDSPRDSRRTERSRSRENGRRERGRSRSRSPVRKERRDYSRSRSPYADERRRSRSPRGEVRGSRDNRGPSDRSEREGRRYDDREDRDYRGSRRRD